MFSAVADIRDSLLEKGGRCAVLEALAAWRTERTDLCRASQSTISVLARLGSTQTYRILKELRGEDPDRNPFQVIDLVEAGKGPNSASKYRFVDDRFLRVATSVRMARRAVMGRVNKQVADLDLMGRPASAENCRLMIEAMAAACAYEGRDDVAKMIRAQLAGAFFGEANYMQNGESSTPCKSDRVEGKPSHFAHQTPTLSGKSPTPPNKEIPQGYPPSRACLSALAREAGVSDDDRKWLNGAEYRVGDDQQLEIIVSKFVRSQLMQKRHIMAQLLTVARNLGCDGFDLHVSQGGA